MNTNFDPTTNGASRPADDWTHAGERWQGPGFAASWISPPRPHRGLDDPMLPNREDDHA